MAEQKKYAGLEAITSLIQNVKTKYATLGHKHTSSDITDLKIPTKVSELTNDAGYVPNTRTVNGKALSADITLAKSDVGLGNVDNTADSAKSVKYATSAGSATTATSATSATKATQDASGNVITTTYETKANATTKYDELTEAIGSKSDTGHTHSIANVTNLQSSLDAKVPTTRTVNGKALSSNISLTASDVGAATTANVNTAVSNHNTSTSAHSDIRGLISDLSTKLNNFLDIDDTTTDQLSEVITLINNNKGTLESLTISKVNVSDIVDNLTTSNASKVLSAKQGVAIKALIDALDSELASHGHDIADISGLQSALDGKAASSHGTHVSYSTTAPVMDGTASAGSASTVARSDHKHPTDTTRASKTEFDTHASDTTKHITSTERTNWNAAKTHADTAHAPSNAEKNQNAFSNVTVGSTTIAADTATDTLTLVAGSNVTITPDATNDKITIAATNTTYSAGTGISFSGTTINNSGVRSVATGSSNGTISVNTGGSSANVAVKGLGSAAYTASTAYDASGAAATAESNAKAYTDEKIANILNNSTEAVDSVMELAAAMEDNADAIEALETVAAGKQATITGGATTITSSNLTANRALISNGSGKVAVSTVTSTELGYLDGVTSDIQTQLDGKSATTHKHAASDITSGTIATARLPQANGASAGITIVYPAASCTTFSSDSGTVTPLAVQKGAKMFAITRPSATTNKAVARYSNTTGDVQDSKILIEDVTNTRDTSKKANVLSIPAEGGKKMVYGYCTDQIDGTSFIGGVFDANATEFPYAQGLAIGGTSGNLLWKGDKVATATDISSVQTQLNGKASSSHDHNASNINAGILSSDRLPTVPVSKGGTGATTATAARTNLDVYSKAEVQALIAEALQNYVPAQMHTWEVTD